MMVRRVLFGLIVLTAASISFVHIALQDYLAAILSIALGSLWLILQIRIKNPPNTLFFLLFLCLVILGSLRNFALPIMLGAVSSNLAAWDLSRFWARLANEEESDSISPLQAKHLQKLAATVTAGFFVALVPALIQISIHFVVFLLLIVLIMLTLRKSMLSLRN